MCLRFDERVLVRVWICEPALRNVLGCGHVYGMTHLTAVRMCVPSLSPFPQLDSYADLCFSVWEVNSRVPVLGLKITLGLKFLIPPPPPPPLFSSFLTGTLLTSPFACFSFPRCLLFWNRLCSLRLSFFFPSQSAFSSVHAANAHTWTHAENSEEKNMMVIARVLGYGWQQGRNIIRHKTHKHGWTIRRIE